jgi:hypothetical protein
MYRRHCDTCDKHIESGTYSMILTNKGQNSAPFFTRTLCPECAPNQYTTLLYRVLHHEFAELSVRWEETI